MTHQTPLVLLTGATGYVGTQLLPRLEAQGVAVRCLVRTPASFKSASSPATQVVRGDLLEAETLVPALEGVDTAYYLVHSMGNGDGFEEADRRAAHNFARVARKAGVRHIIYLGGLGGDSGSLSAHLRSRQEVGEILRSTGIPVTELRASIVLGRGSLSYEMIRALTERLPVMVTPKWVDVKAQPIAIDDLLEYLLQARTRFDGESRIFEVGGADRVSYGDLMREYARQRGLRRWMIPVPFLTPRLSGLWLGLVTPLYASVGRKLVESIKNATVVEDESALSFFSVSPLGVPEAMRRALGT